jgi:dipeptidyl aminopeptidase/acylaminoacyl peptidase
MDIKQNGGRVAGILKANGTPMSYHVIPGIGHYGVYTDKFNEALKLELDWFDKYLKPTGLAQPKSDPQPKSDRD